MNTATSTPADRFSPQLDAVARPLRQALARELRPDGKLLEPEWEQAVAEVPRHWFLPGFYTEHGPDPSGLPVWEPVTPRSDAAAYLEAVYADRTLITQFDEYEPDWDTDPAPRSGGHPTSSSTLPSLVLTMWHDADLADDQDVLEIGTGTGYSTALYSHRYGSARLTSIDVDPGRVDQAAAALYRLGYGPRLAVADGLYGYAPYAPYDRIVAACSVRAVPAYWLEQTKPGGKILTTLGGWLYGSARALLTVTGPGTAEGRLLPGTISFMLARLHQPPSPGSPPHWERLLDRADPRPARHTPDRLNPVDAAAFHRLFLAQLAAPDAQLTAVGDTTYLIDVVSASVAALAPAGDGWQVRQAGPVRLWDRIEDAFDHWDQAGRPGSEQFTVRIGPGGHQLIEHPSTPALSFALPQIR